MISGILDLYHKKIYHSQCLIISMSLVLSIVHRPKLDVLMKIQDNVSLALLPYSIGIVAIQHMILFILMAEWIRYYQNSISDKLPTFLVKQPKPMKIGEKKWKIRNWCHIPHIVHICYILAPVLS